MNRALIHLAMTTGIPPSVWESEGDRAIITALELLEQKDEPKG